MQWPVRATSPRSNEPIQASDSSSSAEYLDKGRNVAIYFYPKADTPGCTKESMDFSRLKPEFERANTTVIGVSASKSEQSIRCNWHNSNGLSMMNVCPSCCFDIEHVTFPIP